MSRTVLLLSGCLLVLVMMVGMSEGQSSQFETIWLPSGRNLLKSNVSYPKDASWGDFDSDGFMDLAVTSRTNNNIPNPVVYRNLRTETSSFLAMPGLTHTMGTMAQWGDYNNDNILDLLVGGSASPSCDLQLDSLTALYKGLGNGSFAQVATFGGYCYVTAAWADFNNDGFSDIVLIGTYNDTAAPSSNSTATLWINQGGTGIFNPHPMPSQIPPIHSDVCVGDYDSDGWLDLVVIGTDTRGLASTLLLRNQGGYFSLVSAPFSPVTEGSCSWMDYDADGYLDLLLTGQTAPSGSPITQLWRNYAAKSWTPIYAGLPDMTDSAAGWGDYNNDGLPDLCLIGINTANSSAAVYNNVGNNSFATYPSLFLMNDSEGNCIWADYNADGLLDVYTDGAITEQAFISRNLGKSIPKIQPPPPPSNPTYRFQKDGSMRIMWSRPSNTHGTLTFNVGIAGGILSPMALPTGNRLVAQMGNAQSRWFMDVLYLNSSLSYNVSVQTIDAAYRGSAFVRAVRVSSSSSASSANSAAASCLLCQLLKSIF